jgi:hypothetical protein
MDALLLATSLGRRPRSKASVERLYGDKSSELPKSLLTFAGETLLTRRNDALVACGMTSLTLIVGHRPEGVCAKAFKFASRDVVQCTAWSASPRAMRLPPCLQGAVPDDQSSAWRRGQIAYNTNR